MKPFYKDNHNTLYCLDFRKNELPDECVQMACTSPPYWGLRKYSGVPDLIWGGKDDCEHEFSSKIPMVRHKAGETNPGKEYYTKDTGQWGDSAGTFCSLCGALEGARQRGQKDRIKCYEHRLDVLEKLNTPKLIRERGAYLSYWSDRSTHYLPRRIPIKGVDIDLQLEIPLSRCFTKEEHL